MTKPAQGSARSWRDALPVHPAADMFPLMSSDELKALGKDISKNGQKVSIVLWSADDASELFLLDGRNRLDAMEAVGFRVIIEEPGSFPLKERVDWVHVTGCGNKINKEPATDPYEYVISANIHRRHLTAEQKRELIGKLLKTTPEASNNSIASQVKADDKTVASVRRELEATSEIPKLEKTTGTDGKERPAKK